MDSVALYTKEGKEVAWFCNNCHTLYASEDMAEKCCKPIICEKCGRPISRDRTKGLEAYYINPIRCSDCYIQDKWNMLECLTEEEYHTLCQEDDSYGPVFVDSDGYADLYEALESIVDDYDNIEDVPTEFELGQWQKMDPLNIEDILYDRVADIAGDNWDPSVEDVYEDVQSLFDFVKQWNKKQVHYKYYTSCNKKVKVNLDTIKEYWND